VTSGIDLDLTTKEWGKCDDRDCVYIIGDLEDAFPITRKEILGPC
jgi:hypothetical protein